MIVGVGNPDRGDDAIGPVIARRFAERDADTADCTVITGDCTALVDHLAERDHVVIVDACRAGTAAGSLHRFDTGDTELPAALGGLSTHGFGVGEAVALARAMNAMPRTCLVLAIEVATFEAGAPLSTPVAAAVEPAMAAISAHLAGIEV